MKFSEFSVCRTLRPFVRSIWQLEGRLFPNENLISRIVPDGVVEFVIHYQTPYAIRYGESPTVIQPTGALISQTNTFVEIEQRGDSGFVSVRFEPWGAQNFIPSRVHDFVDGMVSAEDIWGDDGTTLIELVNTAKDHEQRLSHIQLFLLQQLRKNIRDDISPIVQYILGKRGMIRIPDLCAMYGLTTRRVERCFNRSMGISPKSYSKLCRFLATCKRLTTEEDCTLTDIAHDTGYYDQSHFIGEFREYAGVTPGEFRRRDDISFLEIC